MSTMSIGEAIAWLAQQAPERTAITDPRRSVTRQELHLRTNRLARAYRELGVGQDDFVTVALPNGIGFYEACIATWKLGATPQPISAKLPAVERHAIIELARPKLVVGSEDVGEAPTRALAADFEPDPALDDSDMPYPAANSWKAPTSGGSTGRPKIIVAKQKGVTDPERTAMALTQLVPGPLYHNAPFMFSMQSLFAGGELIVMRRFDAEEALQLIEKHRVEYVLLVPTMMHRIWRLGQSVRERYDVSSIKRILHLGAPCPPWLKEVWIEWLGPEKINELYAGTEAQVATVISGSEWLEHRGSVGKVRGGGQIKIFDADGKELPPGEVGEVFMLPAKGQGSTYSYIGAQAKSRDGWESLGDMGYLDQDGYLYLADRQTDMILSGGANVYPAEVEAAIDAHPTVRSSAAIGLPDDDLGQRVHAIVDIADSPEGAVDDASLAAFLGDRLARYKIPRSFEFVREPVRDDAGKVRRSALRKARLTDDLTHGGKST
ncbi:MAG: AMP-binding protein [Myxococcales bacterium]|nr:AMP-binding protein [Myxococcales bacterium]